MYKLNGAVCRRKVYKFSFQMLVDNCVVFTWLSIKKKNSHMVLSTHYKPHACRVEGGYPAEHETS